MGDIMIQSNARGDWSADFGDGDKKFTVTIKMGLNTLSAKEYDAVKKDPGFEALVKKGKFKEMKPADLKKREREQEKAEAKIKELDEAKAKHKKEISELEEKHKQEIKDLKGQHNTEMSSLVKSKGEALEKVKELESEVDKLKRKTADLGSINKELDELRKAKESLLEENGVLADKVKESEAEVKKLQKKLKENDN